MKVTINYVARFSSNLYLKPDNKIPGKYNTDFPSVYSRTCCGSSKIKPSVSQERDAEVVPSVLMSYSIYLQLPGQRLPSEIIKLHFLSCFKSTSL